MKPSAECSDSASLTCAIQELCAEKGVVAYVDVWTLARSASARRYALSGPTVPRGKNLLAGMPGLTRFGKELLFIVDLPPQSPNLL